MGNGNVDLLVKKLRGVSVDEPPNKVLACAVVWCAADPVLTTCLRTKRDYVLNIVSPSRVKLSKFEDAFTEDTRGEVSKLIDSRLLRKNWANSIKRRASKWGAAGKTLSQSLKKGNSSNGLMGALQALGGDE